MSEEESSVLLVAENVSHGFNDLEGRYLSILKSIDLQVNSGDSLAIVGPSGAGKSTLLALLAGLDVAAEGEIRFKGKS